MKFKFLFVFALVLVSLFVVPMAQAAAPVVLSAQEAAPITADQVLLAILYVAGIIALLPGVSLFNAAITNSLKSILAYFGVGFDGRSDQVAAWLNLAIFALLVYFRVFQPAVSFELIDAKFKLIAEALTALSFLFGQLQLQPIGYAALKGKLPWVGTSYSASS